MSAEYLIAGILLVVLGLLQIGLERRLFGPDERRSASEERDDRAGSGSGRTPIRVWRAIAGYIALALGLVLVVSGLAGF